MTETYKKIDDNILELTTITIQRIEKQRLLEEKKMRENEIVRSQAELAEIDKKLNILK